jgi:hypothetical protein
MEFDFDDWLDDAHMYAMWFEHEHGHMNSDPDDCLYCDTKSSPAE